MKKFCAFLAFASSALVTLPSISADRVSIKAGEYISSGGWGTLAVKKENNGDLSFKLESVGSNGHTCALDGTIEHGHAELDVGEDDKKCIVDFSSITSGSIEVTAKTQDLCRYFCGVRAGFDGTYFKPRVGCSNAEKNESYTQFKQLYEKKQYALARKKIEPILLRCANTLFWGEENGLRNDLAITQFHLKDFTGCTQTLKPLTELASMSNEDISETFPPMDAEAKIDIAKATRTNLKLCKSKRN